MITPIPLDITSADLAAAVAYADDPAQKYATFTNEAAKLKCRERQLQEKNDLLYQVRTTYENRISDLVDNENLLLSRIEKFNAETAENHRQHHIAATRYELEIETLKSQMTIMESDFAVWQGFRDIQRTETSEQQRVIMGLNRTLICMATLLGRAEAALRISATNGPKSRSVRDGFQRLANEIALLYEAETEL